MATPPLVAIIGMKALRRDIDQLADSGGSGPLNLALRRAGYAAATPVADAVRSALPKDTGTLAGDVRISATKAGATVRYGRKSIPYAGPVDFGGWPENRDYDARGRYLFPSAGGLAERAVQLYSDAVQRTFDSFGWTNSTDDGAAVHD